MRADLLALSEATLTDLTNKGTVRRALKEVDGVEHAFTERDDGTLIVEASDGVACELHADRPFADWTCTCFAGTSCRHIVRAVFAYQSAATAEPLGPDAVESPPDVPTTPAPSDPFDPASITDDDLTAALPPAVLRAAQRILSHGALGLIGRTNTLTTVRIHYPTPVTVRFLADGDLRYVRCTCREPDPCSHVPVAVAIARGTPSGTTGLRTVDGDAWTPPTDLLADVRRQLEELIEVGIEGSHRGMQMPWQRLRARAEGADLPHVRDLIDELLAESARYAERHTAFDPARLVAVTGELLARITSLGGTHADRIPDRLVAGAKAQPTDVDRSRLIGMGTEVVDAVDSVTLIAYLVDARSGSPLRVTKVVPDEEGTSAHRLAKRVLGGVPFDQWGGGQVMVPSGKRFGNGDFSPGRGRIVTMPKADLTSLSAPFVVGSVAELAAHQTRLPPALDDRAAGTDLAACRFVEVADLGFDPSAQELVATLVDGEGGRARLALPSSPRVDLGATAALLASWAESPPGEFHVSARWRWSTHGATLLPLLVVADDVALQPGLAAPSELELPVAGGTDALTSPAALLRELDAVLGQTLVAGLDRLAHDRRGWEQFARRASSAGSMRVAGLARQVAAEMAPAAVLSLVLVSVFGHPVA